MSKISDFFSNIFSDRRKLINSLVLILLLIVLPLSLVIAGRERIFRSRAAVEPAIVFAGDNVSESNGRQTIKAVIEDDRLIWRAQVHLTAPTAPLSNNTSASLLNNFSSLFKKAPSIKTAYAWDQWATWNPSNLNASCQNANCTNIRMNWNANGGWTCRYLVKADDRANNWNPGVNPNDKNFWTSSPDITSIDMTGLGPNVDYEFRVQGFADYSDDIRSARGCQDIDILFPNSERSFEVPLNFTTTNSSNVCTATDTVECEEGYVADIKIGEPKPGCIQCKPSTSQVCTAPSDCSDDKTCSGGACVTPICPAVLSTECKVRVYRNHACAEDNATNGTTCSDIGFCNNGLCLHTDPPPSASPPSGRSCNFEQSCQVANFTGTQYCESILDQNDKCITSDPSVAKCYYDKTAFGKLPENLNKCKVNIDTLALVCQVSPQNRAGLNENVTWTAQYNTQITQALGSVSVRYSSDLLEDPIKELPPAPANSYPNPKTVKYTVAGNYKPRVSLVLGDTVRTQEVTCPQISVGESSLTATLSLPETAQSHKDVNVTFGVNEAAGGRLKDVNVYVVKALGGVMSRDECGNGNLVDSNSRCRIFGRTNLTGTSFNSSTKWQPKVAGAYIAYVEGFTQSGGKCTGRRDTIDPATGFTPCGNESSDDITVTLSAATSKFKIAESVTDLNTAIERTYDSHPKIIEYTFKSQTPGQKTVYVDFILNDGKSQRKSVNVELVPPDITDPIGVACSLDLSGKGLNVTVRGKYFGLKNNTNALKANGAALKINDWKDDLITATLANPSIPAETGQDYKIEVVRSDGHIAQGSCRVGVSQISLGAKSMCRSSLSVDQDNVDIVLVEAQTGATAVRKKVKITKDGKIDGLTNLLQNGKCYKLSVKAPNSIRKVIEFQAYEGTTVLNNFNLATGDIFPSGGDGKINSLDRSEIIRQWSVLGSFNSRPTVGTGSAQVSGSAASTNRVLTGDFNKDGLINTFDLSCMLFDFFAEDVTEPAAGPVSNASLRAQCDSASPAAGSGSQNLIQTQSSPNPTSQPSASSSTKDSGSQVCLQVLTPARNTETKECKVFPNSCIPSGWVQENCNETQ